MGNCIMLNKFKIGSGLLCAIALTACQSTPTNPVIARSDNTFETTGFGKTKTEAQNSALTSAKAQCGHKTPIIIKDTLNYQGVIDEKVGRVAEQSAKVIGAILGMGTPEISRDDDYEYFITFKCQ